jgi:hypothetical protein
MKTVVTIDKKEYRFDELLNLVSRQTAAVFSFSTKKIASDKTLKLNTGRQTLEDLLTQIKVTTGLYYKIVGNHIIFLDKQPAITKSNSTVNQPKTSAKVSVSTAPLKHKQVKEENLSFQRASIPAVSNTEKIPVQKSSRGEDSASEKQMKNAGQQNIDTLVHIDKNFSDTDNIKKRDSLKQSNGGLIQGERNVMDSINATNNVAIPNDRVAKSRRVTGRKEIIPSKLTWFIGAEFLTITNAENQSEKLKASGFGVGIKIEREFGKKFSWTIGAHWNYFKGNYIYSTFNGSLHDTITHFAFIPVLVGIKYYPINKWYVSFETGPSFKTSRMGPTKLGVVPSAGVLLPLRNGSGIDLGMKYTHIIRGFATPETPGLQAGGYGILSLRVAYGIKGL